ncbi:glucosamine-6-phosphate deaminase [Bacillus sp. B15-48]|uniref:glucosamine-6-phosphate deaminase n=1 Tax=Bacillus sp. B15-48 TaxID=1548601 RepID=UPI00194013E3|nr:glucosamine-6-phosphate deaminase [Bacillus sp. B15-48]MBM4761028.1 glucosamine-6-phosphate deaminase [Bacillus sp. B15-48]
MKIIKVKNYDELSLEAAKLFIEKVRKNPSITLGLATGGTPVGLYAQIVKDHQENDTSYQKVTSFNLDEYIGLSGEHPQSYRYFMNEQLFNHIDIDKANTFVPLGDTENPQQQCVDYENRLKEHGGIDLQILGIGSNGHIAFNEPGTSFQSETHIIELTASTREANARFFDSIDEVPTHAITMGIASIMRSKEILLLISGEGKREALSQLIHGEATEDFPASVLKNHPNVTIIADEAALGA